MVKPRQWEKLAAELRTYQQEVEATWGGIDDVTVAKYISGEATLEESKAVEKGMREFPAVRELVETVKQATQKG